MLFCLRNRNRPKAPGPSARRPPRIPPSPSRTPCGNGLTSSRDLADYFLVNKETAITRPFEPTSPATRDTGVVSADGSVQKACRYGAMRFIRLTPNRYIATSLRELVLRGFAICPPAHWSVMTITWARACFARPLWCVRPAGRNSLAAVAQGAVPQPRVWLANCIWLAFCSRWEGN